MTRKKPANLDDLIDATEVPVETGVPQRGARIPPREQGERRSDVISIRAKPSTRAALLAMSERTRIPVAELFEKAVALLEREGY